MEFSELNEQSLPASFLILAIAGAIICCSGTRVAPRSSRILGKFS
jgi:hypothetical protein